VEHVAPPSRLNLGCLLFHSNSSIKDLAVRGYLQRRAATRSTGRLVGCLRCQPSWWRSTTMMCNETAALHERPGLNVHISAVFSHFVAAQPCRATGSPSISPESRVDLTAPRPLTWMTSPSRQIYPPNACLPSKQRATWVEGTKRTQQEEGDDQAMRRTTTLTKKTVPSLLCVARRGGQSPRQL